MYFHTCNMIIFWLSLLAILGKTAILLFNYFPYVRKKISHLIRRKFTKQNRTDRRSIQLKGNKQWRQQLRKVHIDYIPFTWMAFQIMISARRESVSDLSNSSWLIVFAKANSYAFTLLWITSWALKWYNI